MNGRGSGKYAFKYVDKTLKENGYELVRNRKHYIYKDKLGHTLAIPQSMHNDIIKRLFKQNGVIESR